MSKIILKNTSNTEFEINHEGTRSKKTISSTDIAVAIDTIFDFPADAATNDVFVVRDSARGGTFVIKDTGTANDGTVFAVGSKFAHRIYSGAVNIKWFSTKTQAANYCEVANEGLEIDIDTTFNVPTDFTTIQSALSLIIRSNSIAKAIINIESLHTLTSSVSLNGGDYSYISIESVDATVAFNAVFTQISTVGLFVFKDCHAPVFNIVVDASGIGVGGGISGIYYTGSRGHINTTDAIGGAGVINSEYRGLYVVTSHVRAQGSIWTGAVDAGIRCSNNGILQCRNGNTSNSGTGLSVGGGALVNATGLISTGCTIQGVYINGGYCSGSNIDASNGTTDGIVVIGGTMSGDSLIINNVGRYGLSVYGGGKVVGTQVGAPTPYSIINSGTASIYARESSSVSASSANLSGSGIGVIAETGSEIIVDDANITNSGSYSIQATSGSRVIAISSDCSNPGNRHVLATSSYVDISSSKLTGRVAYSIFAQLGSTIIANNITDATGTGSGIRCLESDAQIKGSNFTSDGVTTATTDIEIFRGSIIKADSTVGGVNNTVNTLTSAGIIFR